MTALIVFGLAAAGLRAAHVALLERYHKTKDSAWFDGALLAMYVEVQVRKQITRLESKQ